MILSEKLVSDKPNVRGFNLKKTFNWKKRNEIVEIQFYHVKKLLVDIRSTKTVFFLKVKTKIRLNLK